MNEQLQVERANWSDAFCDAMDMAIHGAWAMYGVTVGWLLFKLTGGRLATGRENMFLLWASRPLTEVCPVWIFPIEETFGLPALKVTRLS